MTVSPDPGHLIERAARRLRASGDASAAGLLPPVNSQEPPQPPAPAPPNGGHGRAASLFTPAAAPAAAFPAYTDEPISGAVEKATLERGGMIDWTKSRQRMSEEFRIIQGQLVQAVAGTVAKGKSMPNVVMITSARPGEGKTFTSLNLAGSLARYGSRPVILVDMDSSRHTLSSRLGLDQAPGLLDVALDPTLRIERVILPTSMPGLSLLPIGGLGGARASLSASTPIIDMLERLGRQFQSSTVILDAPPCLSSSDPSNIAHLCGQTVLLVEAQRTQRSEVEAALDLIDGCPSVSLILTKVKLTASDTFGAYGYY